MINHCSLMSPQREWKPQVHPSGWPSHYIITFSNKGSSDFTNLRWRIPKSTYKLNQTLQSGWVNKDIFVLPLGWMAQFSCCWCNSALWRAVSGKLLGDFRTMNSALRQTSGKNMLCICLCSRSSWPTCSLLPLRSLPVSAEGLLLLMLACCIDTGGRLYEGRWGPASATCHITLATQTWGPGLGEQDTVATSDQVVCF